MGQKRSQHRFAIALGAIQIMLAVFYGVFVRYGGSADAINFKDNKDAWQEMAITYPCEANNPDLTLPVCLFYMTKSQNMPSTSTDFWLTRAHHAPLSIY